MKKNKETVSFKELRSKDKEHVIKDQGGKNKTRLTPLVFNNILKTLEEEKDTIFGFTNIFDKDMFLFSSNDSILFQEEIQNLLSTGKELFELQNKTQTQETERNRTKEKLESKQQENFEKLKDAADDFVSGLEHILETFFSGKTFEIKKQIIFPECKNNFFCVKQEQFLLTLNNVENFTKVVLEAIQKNKIGIKMKRKLTEHVIDFVSQSIEKLDSRIKNGISTNLMPLLQNLPENSYEKAMLVKIFKHLEVLTFQEKETIIKPCSKDNNKLDEPKEQELEELLNNGLFFLKKALLRTFLYNEALNLESVILLNKKQREYPGYKQNLFLKRQTYSLLLDIVISDYESEDRIFNRETKRKNSLSFSDILFCFTPMLSLQTGASVLFEKNKLEKLEEGKFYEIFIQLFKDPYFITGISNRSKNESVFDKPNSNYPATIFFETFRYLYECLGSIIKYPEEVKSDSSVQTELYKDYNRELQRDLKGHVQWKDSFVVENDVDKSKRTRSLIEELIQVKKDLLYILETFGKLSKESPDKEKFREYEQTMAKAFKVDKNIVVDILKTMFNMDSMICAMSGFPRSIESKGFFNPIKSKLVGPYELFNPENSLDTKNHWKKRDFYSLGKNKTIEEILLKGMDVLSYVEHNRHIQRFENRPAVAGIEPVFYYKNCRDKTLFNEMNKTVQCWQTSFTEVLACICNEILPPDVLMDIIFHVIDNKQSSEYEMIKLFVPPVDFLVNTVNTDRKQVEQIVDFIITTKAENPYIRPDMSLVQMEYIGYLTSNAFTDDIKENSSYMDISKAINLIISSVETFSVFFTKLSVLDKDVYSNRINRLIDIFWNDSVDSENVKKLFEKFTKLDTEQKESKDDLNKWREIHNKIKKIEQDFNPFLKKAIDFCSNSLFNLLSEEDKKTIQDSVQDSEKNTGIPLCKTGFGEYLMLNEPVLQRFFYPGRNTGQIRNIQKTLAFYKKKTEEQVSLVTEDICIML